MGGADGTGVFPVSASLQAYRSGEPGNGSKFRETATVCRIAVQMPAAAGPRPIKPAAVLAPVKAKPKRVAAKTRPALTGPARDGCENCGRDGRMLAARVEPKNGPGSAVEAIPIRGSSDAAGSNELSQDFSDVAGADARGVAQLALRERCFSFGENLFDALPSGRLGRLGFRRLLIHELESEGRWVGF